MKYIIYFGGLKIYVGFENIVTSIVFITIFVSNLYLLRNLKILNKKTKKNKIHI